MTVKTTLPPAPAPALVPSWRREGALALATLAAMALLLAAAFLYAPEEIAQGAPQRIFYIHVPSAWVGFLAFAVVFVASIALLATGRRRFDDVAAASAEVGTLFTSVVLVTGSLWARPVWGVYWSWDPRLTSYFILWLVYLSYLALRGYVADPARRARFSAVLGIAGFVNVPIVYLSVRWWRALHPEPIVIVRGGPRMPAEMVQVLLLGLVAFTLLYLFLLALRLHVGRLRDAAEGEGS
jgi:heme exporter protein C